VARSVAACRPDDDSRDRRFSIFKQTCATAGPRVEQGVELAVDVEVAGDVGARDAELTGVGEHPGEGFTAKDLQREVVGRRTTVGRRRCRRRPRRETAVRC
jgi:hypothetical protein